MRRDIRVESQEDLKTIRRKVEAIIVFIFSLILLFLFYKRLNNKLIPTAMTIAHIKANSIATQTISNAINESFRKKNITAQDLVIYDYNDEEK